MTKKATNTIDYQGKIVISGGRKAKVVNEIRNKLEIVFQENGKYQGNVATVRKGEVTLLDKRKHPEKYPLSAEEKKKGEVALLDKRKNLERYPLSAEEKKIEEALQHL